jgi:2-dehydropantoate 2-reductase
MKIAVIGAGAMGCLFGGRLAQAGHEVVLVDVFQPQIDALNEHGLLLTDDNGSSRINIVAARAAELSGVRELLIFFTKAMHSAAAVRDAKHLFGPQSWALTVQNGIGNDDAIAAHIGRKRLIVGMTNYSADLVSVGQVATHGFGEIRIWASEQQPNSRVSDIATCLDAAGLVCRTDPNVQNAIWEKVTFNAAMNAVAAITRLPVGGLAKDPDARNLLKHIVEEASLVARAAGHAIEPAHVWSVIEAAFVAHQQHTPSMLQDILAGRLTEIDAINGAIVLQGRKLGVSTPYNDALTSLVRVIQRSAQGTTGVMG